jgi:hypothetical protein
MKTVCRFSAILIVVLTLAFSATVCIAGLPEFGPDSVPPAPDYANSANWLTVPDNPEAHPVDIFWAYPTVLHDDTHWLMDITSTEMRQLARKTITRQASVFLEYANLYVPMYRQMNMAALSLSPEEQDKLLRYGMEDVWNALNYYLSNLNKGRPFILAGHSQGSNILVDLMVKHWGSLNVEDRLVAGYCIGWSITSDDLKKNPALKMCTDAKQNGCFIAYNTMAAGRQSVAPTLLPGSVVVNPLTWKTDGSYAPAELNTGSRFFNQDGSSQLIPNFTSAQVRDFGLVVEPKDPKLVTIESTTFPSGVYHQFDYSLFYENLRLNTRDRIHAYFHK